MIVRPAYADDAGPLWIAVLLNIISLGTRQMIGTAGGVGTYVPGLILILLGVYSAP